MDPGLFLTLFLAGLTAQKFNCVTQQPTGVTECIGTIPAYAQPIHLFVPANYAPDPGLPLDVMFHLHGFLLGAPIQQTVFERFDFPNLVSESGRSGVLVVPEIDASTEVQGPDGPVVQMVPDGTVFDEFFSDATATARFFSGLRTLVNQAAAHPLTEIPRLTITGHSGAYQIIARLEQFLSNSAVAPELAHWNSTGLFECEYGDDQEFANLAKTLSSAGNDFYSIFINHGTADAGTPEYYNALTEADLRTAGIPFVEGVLAANSFAGPDAADILFEAMPLSADPDEHWDSFLTHAALYWQATDPAKAAH